MDQNEITYLVTMILFRKMVTQGLLTEREFSLLDAKMREKYQPKIGTIFVDCSSGQGINAL